MSAGKVRIGLSIPAGFHAQMVAVAASEFRPVSSFILGSVSEYINHKEGERKRQETLQKRKKVSAHAGGVSGALAVHESTPETTQEASP